MYKTYTVNQIFMQSSAPIKVWVLAPYLDSAHENINFYYDFSQSIAEYDKVFRNLEMQWQWQPVTLQNFQRIIDEIYQEKIMRISFPIVFNICDGDEINGAPGISVIKYLTQKKLVYTGSNQYFYNITTSKISMKKAFFNAAVQTPSWEVIKNTSHRIKGIFERLGCPVILKPAVSGGSMGVGVKNVVRNDADLLAQIQCMLDGYRGWNLAKEGIIAEAFITGPEFTVFITGPYFDKSKSVIYTPVERVFHPSLPATERFLSFDRLWEIYEEECPMPNDENFYEYALPADEDLIESLKEIAWEAYVATKGVGYARVDIRMDEKTGRLFVLEINAQCGLSEDENYTSIGAILRLSNITFTESINKIINDAIEKNKTRKRISSKIKI